MTTKDPLWVVEFIDTRAAPTGHDAIVDAINNDMGPADFTATPADEHRARATIERAAPDLLAACREALEFVEAYEETDITRPVAETLRAAIARARDET